MGAIGKNVLTMFFVFSKVYTRFCILMFPKTKLKFWCNADVGRVRLVGQLEQKADEPAERAVGREILHDLDMVETLAELQQHIEGLSL